MNSFKLKIVDPESCVFSDDILTLSVRGSEGDLAVMAGHIPFITGVKEGECTVTLKDETVKNAHTKGGLLVVSNEDTTFLSDGFTFD